MNGLMALAHSIQTTDESLRDTYVSSVKSTVFLAFGLMMVQTAWTNKLDIDQNKAVMAAMTPSGAGTALSYAYDFQYQEDSQSKDTQCGAWQNMVQSNQAQLDNTSDERLSNFKLAEGAASVFATSSNLIQLLGG